jgi:purine-binding chemotaxis protein CheW
MNTPDRAQIVTFRLGDELFAADIFAVERVLRYQAPTPIPNVPDWIAGVLDYRGRVVPVLDLRRRFGMPPREVLGDTRILVFVASGQWIAAIVDAVLEVAAVDPSKLAPPPPLFRGLAGEYLRGLVRHGSRLIVYLDVGRLLTSTERLHIDQAAEPALDLESAEAVPAGRG